MSSDYRLSPAFGARLMGLLLVCVAVLVFVTTVVVALLNLHSVVVLVIGVVAVVAVLVVGNVLMRRTYVVQFDETGYRIRLVRGAGVKAAPWKDVEDAVAATPRGIPSIVLRLRDGRTTTIPLQVLAADEQAFVRDLRGHLQRGHGLRPFDGTAGS
jgi:hypothetical protein